MPGHNDNNVLNERSQHLLKVLVQSYIAKGQPVGSKALVNDCGLSLSPATVRNIMADLEEQGLVCSPHTSAGRIPTAQGYRVFVDQLLTVQPLAESLLSDLRLQLGPDKTPSELFSRASQLLSNLSSQAGLVSIPKHNQMALRQVEFLPLSDQRVLVILVVDEREVQNRVIRTEREYSESELKQAANLINERFAGQSLRSVRHAIVDAMRSDKSGIDQYFQASLELASRTFQEEESEQIYSNNPYIVAGERQLLSAAEPERLRDLLDAFEQKKDMLELIDRCLDADGVQLFIGEEAGFEPLGDFSLISAPYRAGDQAVGVLGVIGPSRMAYDRIIPMVDVTARLLSLALK